MSVNLTKTGNRISELMQQQGITAYQLSQKLSVSVQAIYKWTHGRSLPDIDHMIDLCEILGVTLDELIISD